MWSEIQQASVFLSSGGLNVPSVLKDQSFSTDFALILHQKIKWWSYNTKIVQK